MLDTQPWLDRNQLPVAKRLNLNFCAKDLLESYEHFSRQKKWDGLGQEYSGLCETHTRLPKMFFSQEDLKGVEAICDIDWETASYTQMSLTDWDPSYSLEKRTEMSGSDWDKRIAKRNTKADERWYRKKVSNIPSYLESVIQSCGGESVHRVRFAKLSKQSAIKPHIDYDTTYGVRLHIPIITNEKCYLAGIDSNGKEQKFYMPADGGVWFVNPGLRHWAVNDSNEDRIHLILSVDSQKILKS